MACEGFIEPLDLECILVNTFAGSPYLFLIASYLVIAVAAAYFKMKGSTLMLIIFLFTLIVSATKIMDVSSYVIVIAIPVLYFVFHMLSKFWKN